jgi:hypothetical protein
LQLKVLLDKRALRTKFGELSATPLYLKAAALNSFEDEGPFSDPVPVPYLSAEEQSKAGSAAGGGGGRVAPLDAMMDDKHGDGGDVPGDRYGDYADDGDYAEGKYDGDGFVDAKSPSYDREDKDSKK